MLHCPSTMGFLGWMALTGAVLMLMALASSYLRHLPITTSALYLGLGVVLGPAGMALARLDVTDSAVYVERIAEIAVIVSLFVGGLRLRLPLRDPGWRAAFMLAGPVMVISIAGITAVAHLALGMPLASAMLVGAVLAPTDPVLASAVSVNDAADCDRMRYGLSGEAGLNDGMAFPFVVLALSWDASGGAGTWLVEWAAHRVLWAIPAALVLGYLLGKLVGRIAINLRTRQRDTTAPSDLLALALIGLAYVIASAIGAWGFLAVFAAGVGLRGAELLAVSQFPHPEAPAPEDVEGVHDHPPAESMVPASVNAEAMGQPAIVAGVLVFETLSFGDTVERLVEAALIVAVGISLADHWDPGALVIAGALFLVIRPLAARFLLRPPTTNRQRWLMGWFGIRGIGSLYYLGYALTHGLGGEWVVEVIDLTVSVIALSIIAHGITSQPLLAFYERALGRDSKLRRRRAQSSSVAARS